MLLLMHSHDGTQKKTLTSAQIYSRNCTRCTGHLVRGLPPPLPGRTISLVGTQLPDLTHIYHTKICLRPLLRSTRSHALPSIGAAACTMDSQTRRMRPAHEDHQKLAHRPKVTPHRPRVQHRAIWQRSPLSTSSEESTDSTTNRIRKSTFQSHVASVSASSHC